MKAAINVDGLLSIERAGILQRQYCPYHPTEGQNECGDWCPQFGEPDILERRLISISLCNGKLIKCESLEDKRIRG